MCNSKFNNNNNNNINTKIYLYYIMRLYGILFSLFALAKASQKCEPLLQGPCVQFIVSSVTGCEWMCSYCANQLGTNNYYFTDNVCIYQEGQGCVGNPVSAKTYTCCSAY